MQIFMDKMSNYLQTSMYIKHKLQIT